jgi:hypothetical protein
MTNQNDLCPFFRQDSAVCAASHRSRIPPAPVRVSWCASDGHEDCPTFLARLLSALAARLR